MVHPAVRVPALAAPSATVIFLHGLGDTGNGWRFLAEEAHKHKSLQHLNFVFPDAPEREVTLNFGMSMPAWYDILRLNDVLTGQDEPGVLESVETLKQIVREEEAKGTPNSRIVIGGFSQGCAVSLATAVTADIKFAGLVCMSGYLPISDRLLELKKSANINTPIFMGHGTSDNVVKYQFGEKSYQLLTESFGFQAVKFHSYKNLVHSMSPQELQDIMAFLERTLP